MREISSLKMLIVSQLVWVVRKGSPCRRHNPCRSWLRLFPCRCPRGRRRPAEGTLCPPSNCRFWSTASRGTGERPLAPRSSVTFLLLGNNCHWLFYYKNRENSRFIIKYLTNGEYAWFVKHCFDITLKNQIINMTTMGIENHIYSMCVIINIMWS